MIPFVELIAIHPFGVRIPTFGALMTAGIVCGHTLFVRRVRAVGLSLPPIIVEAFTIGVAGSAIATSYVLSGGASSLLAVLGGLAAVLVCSRLARVPVRALLDVAAYAFPPGWALARLGCSLVHDHLGAPSESFLAVAFPGGGRYDAGVLEFLAMLPIAGLALVLGARWRDAGSGRLAAAVAAPYAAARFFIEGARTLPILSVRVACAIALVACAWFALRPARREREDAAEE